MSMRAAFSFAEYRHHPLDGRVPLAQRLPGRTVSFISAGPGGLSLAAVKLGRSGVTVERSVSDPTAANLAAPDIVTRWRAFIRPPAIGTNPVILSVAQRLEWHLKPAVDAATQQDLVYQLRCEPQKILNGANPNIAYTGLLAGGAGVIFGVATFELNAAADALQRARGLVARRAVPALAVLNLLLADPKVLRHEMLPLVVDQGYAIGVIPESTSWRDMQGQPFGAAATAAKDLAGLVDRIKQYDTTNKFLVAISPVNAGLPVEDLLRQASAEVTRFTIDSVREEDLFAYASALF
jgi:hypothetical protein